MRQDAAALAGDLEAAGRTISAAHLADITGTADYVAACDDLAGLLRTAAATTTPDTFADTGPGIVAALDQLASDVTVTSTGPGLTT